MRYHDITMPLAKGMPIWPGDPPLELSQTHWESGVQVTHLSLGAHTGTHVDAPRHVLGPQAPSVDRLRLDILVGPATVVDLRGTTMVTAPLLCDALRGAAPARLLLKLRDEPLTTETFLRYGTLDLTAAQWLVAHGVRLLGLDAPSVDAPETEELAVHHTLLAAGVVIVENLVLEGVASGDWQLACLPLKLVEADGAPARAILWR